MVCAFLTISFFLLLSLLYLDISGFRNRFSILHGGISRPNQLTAIHTLQHDPNCLFMFMVGKSAQGLNLQCANHVFVVEHQFNPSCEQQAWARVDRQGQSKTVFIHRLISVFPDPSLGNLFHSSFYLFTLILFSQVTLLIRKSSSKVTLNMKQSCFLTMVNGPPVTILLPTMNMVISFPLLLILLIPLLPPINIFLLTRMMNLISPLMRMTMISLLMIVFNTWPIFFNRNPTYFIPSCKLHHINLLLFMDLLELKKPHSLLLYV